VLDILRSWPLLFPSLTGGWNPPFQNNNILPMEHTQGHLNCPACQKKAYIARTKIAQDLTYPEAASIWRESREFSAGESGRARYVSQRSLADFVEYDRALTRFFGQLTLKEIHLGHIRQFQEERAGGLLGPTREELFPRYAKRLAKQYRTVVEQLIQDAPKLAIVNAQLDAYPQKEVGPNKINQEVGMLIRILKRAGLWTPEMEESYEPLQHQESDIPRALTPQEQEIFLGLAQQISEFVYCYSILGIHATLSTKEERSLRLADINLGQGIILVRTASSKNKYRTRTIPLTEQAHWAVERLIERANLLGSVQPQHYLMPFRPVRNVFDPNRPMTVSGIKKPWDQVRRAAGVPWFTPYGLRHVGCTRYAEDGVSIHVLLAMAGHMSRKTQQHYIHISEQAKRRAIQKTYGTELVKVKRPPGSVPIRTASQRG
jgi:integrase